ncbi:MAG: 3'(2'),5'-bisphosphate nucleotidase [Proteobacteria bacterium]|nr:3'(2'),5'-bisphosphate nucleotidase [Pseudomonadota bacterium]
MSDRRAELDAAVDAVRAAAHICRRVQGQLAETRALEKQDKSPVTVADFASQAVVCAHLTERLGAQPVVGEEDAAALRSADAEAVREQVVERVREDRPGASVDAVLDWIDAGNAAATGERYWTLDPIDGTKGFLRGEQYAVALALIESGRVVLGVLGCPNLSHAGELGAVFTAVSDEAARVLPLSGAGSESGSPVRVADVSSAAEARLCESVESGHSDQSDSAKIAAKLGITREPYRIDSQCKYAAVSRGDASVYLRLPTRADYQEKIWDHAAGKLVVERAGGRVTDVRGAELDFTRGSTLAANRGVIATSGRIHDEVLEAVRAVRGE